MVLFAGSNAPDLFQEMVSASWCGVLASLSLLLEARYGLRIIVSHTLNAFATWQCFCVCHTTMQQHFIDTSINISMITELESTTGENYPNIDTLLETLGNTSDSLRGGRVGKLLYCLARKEKLSHVTDRETDILTHTQVPHSAAAKTFHFSWQERIFCKSVLFHENCLTCTDEENQYPSKMLLSFSLSTSN